VSAVGRALLVGRLAVRDLRRRPVDAALLLVALMAATTTLTIGLVLHDAASDPFQSTREATAGPDVVASAQPHPSAFPEDPSDLVLDRPAEPAGLEALANAPEVVDHSGPYPVVPAELGASGRTWDVQAVGRDAAPASVDRPAAVDGGWVRDGGVVVEAAFAQALDVRVGDPVTLDGRSFEVVGIAMTAAVPPYPEVSCLVPCTVGLPPDELADAGLPEEMVHDPGLVWLTEADVRRLAPDPESLSWVTNLRLADPDEAAAFVDAQAAASPAAPHLQSWDDVLEESTELARDAQVVLVSGAWLLGLLALASVSVLVGGRLADQTRRVGLLKAVGGTPGLVAAVLLAEYVLVAVVAAAGGLAVGSLTAPWLTEPTAGLVGRAGTPSPTVATVGLVTAVALGVAVVATVVPAVRAARTSTVDALADAARPPRRTGWLIALSARLPVTLLLALRVAARRPRRAVLGVTSIAISVSGVVVALAADAELTTQRLAGMYDDAQADLLGQVLLVVVVMVLSLAAVNAVVLTWATVLDNRHYAALARALGATPRQVGAALAAAQVLPALLGAVLGVFPGSVLLFAAINAANDSDNTASPPPPGQLAAVVLLTVLVVAALTAVPARIGARRPTATTLRAEHP
jgi:ABC-type lipoprotein release transport system permease subunit